jgi:TolB-like protein
MKKIPIFTVILLAIFVTSTNVLAAERKKTLAILDFSNNSLVDKEKQASLSQGLAEIMITELSKIQSLQLVERQKINSLIQEMQLSQSGMISDAAGVQVGKLLGAHFLVFGSYMISFNNKIRVDIRIVAVETGVTVKAEEVTDKVTKLFEIIKQLNEKITKDLNINLTKQEQKSLMETNASLDVISSFSEGLEYEELNKIAEAKKMYMKTLEKDPEFEPAKKRLKELASQD